MNAGGVRHIGPNRMWVEAARRWAAQGIPSARVDFIRVGESDGDELAIGFGQYAPELVELGDSEGIDDPDTRVGRELQQAKMGFVTAFRDELRVDSDLLAGAEFVDKLSQFGWRIDIRWG